MSYDRADWHYNGDYPVELPPENGGTHIGMFLTWAINNHLEGKLHRQESASSLKAVRNRTMTGREFLEKECDEKFTDEDLSEEGNAFALYYYDSSIYFTDYANTLAEGLPSLYHVENNWRNYDRIAPVLTKRFKAWKGGKRWWQFWK